MDDRVATSELSLLHDHLAAPRGRGRLADAPHLGVSGGAPCGDMIRISVRISDGQVAEAGFDAEGCAAARAAGSAVIELVAGRPVLAAARVSPDDVAAALGGLSPERRHAAGLAADALHRAISRAAGDGALRLPAAANRTLVAMSGGVDSAVAARLALEAGDEVIAVTLELWADPAGDGERSCCSPQAVVSARALAHQMGLPHVTLDVRDRFREDVVTNFVAEHSAGRTPNPCIRCNGLVRFDVMLELAAGLGARRLATGHYARIVRDPEGPLVAAAAAADKDQSYVLARLSPEELDRLWFPLGELEKPAVRELAREARLAVADKPDSQDLCFLAGLGAERFMQLHGPATVGSFEPDRPGEVVDSSGRVLGTHRGQHRYTVGQRRGLGIAASEPLYVLAKDAATNRVTVGPKNALAGRRVRLEGAVLNRSGSTVRRVKLRYRSRPLGCRVEGEAGAGAHDTLSLTLDEPVLGVAPGQTACLIEGDRVIGWGTIASEPDNCEVARAC